MTKIFFIDRQTKQKVEEKVYGKAYLEILYGKNPLSWLLKPLMCRFPFFSKFYGYLQKTLRSKSKIAPFIRMFNIDEGEFKDPVSSFQSFNDFFIRQLKPSARPITNGNDVAIIPADGRYRVFQNIHFEEGFLVKGQKFSLEALLKDKKLAHKYDQGSLIIARLAPVDYHRFHFPFNCIPEESRLINGTLYSVNPIALAQNIDILTENKRMITPLKTQQFGTVLYIEVGATYVGSIHQTFTAGKHYAKGDEKGYFSFGGSCILILFEPFRIQFDQDLISASHQGLETLAHLGEPMGRALSLI